MTLRPLEEIAADQEAAFRQIRFLVAIAEPRIADIPAFLAHVRQAARNADELVAMLHDVTAERDALRALMRRFLSFVVEEDMACSKERDALVADAERLLKESV